MLTQRRAPGRQVVMTLAHNVCQFEQGVTDPRIALAYAAKLAEAVVNRKSGTDQ